MLNPKPKEVFLTKGVGVHKFKLSSFEEALRNAGMAHQNIVTVSSILPPGCKIISKKTGLAKISPGSIRYSVLARIETDEHNRQIAASVGIAVPKDLKKWGYISEVHEYGLTKIECSNLAEDIAASMLGTTLGIEIDPDKAWIEKEQIYIGSGLIVHTDSITQTALGKSGYWTTAIAMTVFIL